MDYQEISSFVLLVATLIKQRHFNLDLFKSKTGYESQTGEPPMLFNCLN
jgi:hypothetical protein